MNSIGGNQEIEAKWHRWSNKKGTIQRLFGSLVSMLKPEALNAFKNNKSWSVTLRWLASGDVLEQFESCLHVKFPVLHLK